MEQRYIHTTGLVLAYYPARENDRRIALLTPHMGKLFATARGARSLKSPFISRLQPLHLVELLIYRSAPRGNNTHATASLTITQCAVAETFPHIARDFAATTHALGALEIALRTSHESLPNEMLYNGVLTYLRLLNATAETAHTTAAAPAATIAASTQSVTAIDRQKLLWCWFQLHAIKSIDLLPAFTHCTACHQKIKIDTLSTWHPLALTCADCADQTADTASYPIAYLKLLHFMATHDIASAQKLKLTDDETHVLGAIIQSLWNAHQGVTLRGPSMVEKLRE